MILGNLDEEREFEDIVLDEWLASADDDQFRTRMDALGNRLIEAKQTYLKQRDYDDRLFGERFVPEG